MTVAKGEVGGDEGVVDRRARGECGRRARHEGDAGGKTRVNKAVSSCDKRSYGEQNKTSIVQLMTGKRK